MQSFRPDLNSLFSDSFPFAFIHSKNKFLLSDRTYAWYAPTGPVQGDVTDYILTPGRAAFILCVLDESIVGFSIRQLWM